ncbi:MAG: hypothetical protein UV60_C0006G0040 [Parcubacteria group bacterium GW2011_GWA2_43_11]|nr:MAG: hypothetical protein UU89_C0005G0005 [Parcubacteria group bacterium GW2011_GWC2_42_11]KKS85688.1 MAG: hypothetical protein UV60_C0006G0040 [Parcubacteria group bacterium GW2011_GWA2_43_11]
MDFTKIYLPQPVTLGEFRNQQPANKTELAIRRAYCTYEKEFGANLDERIRNGEKFYSAAEIAERIISIPDEDDEDDDSCTRNFRVEDVTDIPREQVIAFIMDLTIERMFKQINSV